MKKAKGIIIGIILTLIILSIICGAIVFLVAPNSSKIYQKQAVCDENLDFPGNDWLKHIDDEKSLNQINIPGSHDSATFNVFLPYKAKTQEEDIDAQLNMGIRYLDVRLKEFAGNLILSHGDINCLNKKGKDYKFKELVEQCNDFILKNKSEFVIINLKNERIKKPLNELSKDVEKIVKEVVKEENLFTEERIPKLKEVRGKIILARRYGDDGLYGQRIQWRDQKSNAVTKEEYSKNTTTGSIGVLIQDQYRLSEEYKRLAIYEFIDQFKYDEHSYRINFLSNSGGISESPKKFVDCFEFDQRSFELLKKTNGQIIGFDFVNENRVKYIIKTNVDLKIS